MESDHIHSDHFLIVQSASHKEFCAFFNFLKGFMKFLQVSDLELN